jgi:DNA helicase II / ATP-dependent DNA helicase PcrA
MSVHPFTQQLNPPQAKAVEHVHGPLLVFAGAGSGKTRVITFRLANMIANHGVHPARILAVTFTNKAAGEMRERLDALLGMGVASDIWVGTFHAICVRLLRRYFKDVGLQNDFVIYDDADQRAVVTRVMRAKEIDDRVYTSRAMLGNIHRLKQEGIRPHEVDRTRLPDDTILKIYEGYEEHLKSCNACDFDDLLLHVMRLCENQASQAGEEIRQRFHHVLVDEFQDVNSVQYRLVRALASKTRNLCVVGDDDQSIYRWRGADVRNIRGFRKDYPDAVMVKLEENYRSSANVVQAALAIIAKSNEREPKELFTKNPAGDPIHVVTARDERDEAAYVVSKAKQTMADGIAPENIAVFYRIHAMSRVIEEAFRLENLPYRIVGGTRFFDRSEIKDLLSYLRVIVNPRSDVDLLRIINTPARGIGDGTVQKLSALARGRGLSLFDTLMDIAKAPTISGAPRKRLIAFRDMIQGFQTAVTELSPSRFAKRVLSESTYQQFLRDQNNAESDARLENLEELIGSIQEYEEECAYSNTEAMLSGYLERVSLATAGDEKASPRSISLMTVHSAKGLEFDSVFIIGLEEQMFPYVRQASDAPQDDEEERRLAYVAITRARKHLYLTHVQVRTLFGSPRDNRPSRFIAELPRNLLDRTVTPLYEISFGQRTRFDDRSQDRSFDQRPPPSGSSLAWKQREFFNKPAPAPEARKPHAIPGDTYVERDAEVSDYGESVELFPGTRVKHKRYGAGTVKAIHEGVDPSVTVRFPGWGDKKILVRFLQPG